MLEFEGIVFEECKLQFEFILTEIIIYQSQLDSQTRMILKDYNGILSMH